MPQLMEETMPEEKEETGNICSPSDFLNDLGLLQNTFPDVSSKKGKSKHLNPFVHKISLDSLYDRFKLVFMSVFVVPIRAFLIIICLLVAWVLAVVGMFGISKEEFSSKPVSGWRRVAKDQVCQWVRFLYIIYGFHYVQVKGKQARSREAPILAVAPHSSMFDALPLVVLGAPSIVAKSELQEVPFFARYINFTQPVYVRRDDTNSRHNTIMEIKRRANSDLEWSQVMIFPEGTCTNRSCLITFKPGAFYPGVPIQPVVIRYPNKTDCITWTWDGPGAIKNLWITMCQFQNYCELEYLPVYTPSAEEKQDPRLFAQNVRQVMADALGLPVVDYTYDDCRVMSKAKLKNLPCKTGLIEFQKLRHTLGNLTLADVEGKLMNDFADMAPSDGEVTLYDLSDYLGLPSTEPTVEELFNIIDKDAKGWFDFRDFVVFRCEAEKTPCSTETLSEAFKLFDKEGKGTVSEEAFSKALESALELEETPSNKIFQEIDADSKRHFTFDDFKAFCERKPEYSKLFTLYQKSVKDGTRSEALLRSKNKNKRVLSNKEKTE